MAARLGQICLKPFMSQPGSSSLTELEAALADDANEDPDFASYAVDVTFNSE